MLNNSRDVNLTAEDVVKGLIKLGLPGKAAEIYLLLVKNNELRVGQIVKLIGIPRSSVYENLKKLEELGFTETVVDHKFVRIRPYPIVSLKNKLKDQIAEAEKIEKAIIISKKEKLTITTIRYYKGISGARQLFWNTLYAKDTIFVYSAYGRSKFVGENFYKEFVLESSRNKIKEKVLINPTERAMNLIKRDTGTQIARTDVKDIRVLDTKDLLINGETFIYNNIYAQVRLDGDEISGFEIESKEFVTMQRSIFKTLWKLAKPFE